MTFYQELQLSSAGSKQLIKNTTDKKEKRRHILIYNFKVYLVMTFCFALVTLYSMIFGSDNSVAGVVFVSTSGASPGGFWYSDASWSAVYCRYFCYFDRRTEGLQYGLTMGGLCY